MAHAFANTVLYLDWDRKGWPYPIIPISVNALGRNFEVSREGFGHLKPELAGTDVDLTASPPGPSPRSLYRLGKLVREIVEERPERVVLMASSSWSHSFLTQKTEWLFPDRETAANRRLWRLTQVAIGLTAVALWVFAARLGFSANAAAWIGLAAALVFCGHLAVIVFWSDAFLITILHYLPAVLFMAGVLVWYTVAEAAGAGLVGLTAVTLSVGAAAVQAFALSPDPKRLNPNTIYHCLQALALILLFVFVQGRLAV